MRYFGGKARLAKPISSFLKSERASGQLYVEPFLGAGSVFSLMEGPKQGSDTVVDLIEMWQALQDGWIPPKDVSKEEYIAAREGLITGADRAFIGFGCSFGGKWFGGYAKTKDNRNYATNAHNSLMKKVPTIQEAEFSVDNFFDLDCSNCLVYCDPPYSGTTKPGTRTSFDVPKFWDKVRDLSLTNVVFVSEYEAPEDFAVVREKEVRLDMQTTDNKRVERLFRWKQ